MRVAVIGAAGQLGSDSVEAFGAVPLTHGEVDGTDPDSLGVLSEIEPDVVINAAAYVRVEDAEVEADEAFRLNAVGALNVARACNEIGTVNVYISTDYVFDGKNGEPYVEVDSSKHYIIRVASLYGRSGKSNFVDSIIKRAIEEGAVRVVDDIFMSPTYSKDVSDMLWRFLDIEPSFGVYHLVNEGYCSWFDFARKIFAILGEDVQMTPIKSDELGRRSRRPALSGLKNRKLDDMGLEMSGWVDALGDYLVEEAR